MQWFDFAESRIVDGYLFGDFFSVADAYLFVMARGALQAGFPLGDSMQDYVSRIDARPSVQSALTREATSFSPTATLAEPA